MKKVKTKPPTKKQLDDSMELLLDLKYAVEFEIQLIKDTIWGKRKLPIQNYEKKFILNGRFIIEDNWNLPTK